MFCCLMKSSLVIFFPTLIIAHHIALCLSYICLTVWPKPKWVQMWSLKAYDIRGAKKYGCPMESRSFAMCKLTIDSHMKLMVKDYFCHLKYVYNCLIENWANQPHLMDWWWYGSPQLSFSPYPHAYLQNVKSI